MKLAIIGTARRGPDADILTAVHYRMMCVVGQVVAEILGVKTLVSGGSVWSDHVAIRLFLDGAVDDLSLHFPASFNDGRFVPRSSTGADPGGTSNRYHALFSEACNLDSLSDIQDAMRKGARTSVNPGGFKARNTDIANEADAILAFTCSGRDTPPDRGGTRDTWDKFAQKTKDAWAQINMDPSCIEAPCGCTYEPSPYLAFHFDLTNRKLHRTVYSYVREPYISTDEVSVLPPIVEALFEPVSQSEKWDGTFKERLL